MHLPKLLAHRLFLLFLAVVVVVLVATLMVMELQHFFSAHYLDAVVKIQQEEEGITILLIGFGVLLEGRHILQNWIAGHEVETTQTTHLCEYYGFILLALGLFIEMFEQISHLLHSPEITFWIEVLVNYPINAYSLYILRKVAVILSDVQSDTVPSH